MKDINSRVNEFCNLALDWLVSIYDVELSNLDFHFDYDNDHTKVVMFSCNGISYSMDVAYNETNFYRVMWTFRNISDVVLALVSQFNLKKRQYQAQNILTYLVLSDNVLLLAGHIPYQGNIITTIPDESAIFDRVRFYSLVDFKDSIKIHLTLVNGKGVLDTKVASIKFSINIDN